MRSVLLTGVVLSLSLIVAACDGNSESLPTSPDSPGSEGASGGAIVTISSSGIEPRAVMITPGQSVTFVNNDTTVHEMASDPHPLHNDCPAINRVGRLEPGQRRQTDPLMIVRACGFHDLLRDEDPRWQGTIAVQ